MCRTKTTKRKNKSKKIQIPKPNIPKIPTREFPIPQEELEHLRTLGNQNMVFSFKFLELEHEAFNLTGTCYKWSNDLFRLLEELSNISRNRFVNELRDHYRCHTHNWSELDYKYNFSDDFLEQVECRQARISTSKGGIHGFIIGNRFYVVWLDPHHNLYPDERYGGLKIFDLNTTCCEYRDGELDKLKEEIKEYEELFEEFTKPSSS